MKDIKGFVKLFNVNIPVYDEFDYYVNQLSKTSKYSNIKELISLYEEAELLVSDMFAYKMSKIDEIVNYIKETRAYKEMQVDNLHMLPTNKSFSYQEGKRYLSIDLVQANWNSIKTYDPDFLNELGNSYDEFLDKFDLPEVFKKSKQFRQIIFGNLNPKRQARVQRKLIQEVVDTIGDSIKIEAIRHDEVIYSFDHIENILPIVNQFIHNPKSHVNFFTVEKKDGIDIRSYYNRKGEFLYKEMSGCPGNVFFINLKKYVTGEKLDIRDFFFRHEKKTAIWYDENMKVNL